jgi:hypothetical protein
MADGDEKLLDGIRLPVRKTTPGRWTEAEEQEWLDVIEILMSRGVRRYHVLARMTGMTPPAAKRLMGLIKKDWAESMPQALLNERRENLYREAEEVSRLAWTAAMNNESPTIRLSYLKTVLEANKRKASLVGLDRVELQIDARVQSHETVDVVSKVEQRFSLAPGALANIGKSAALLLSRPDNDDDEDEMVIDVEPEPVPA